MKIRTNLWVVSALALGLGACKQKQEVKAPEAPGAVETPAQAVPPAPAPADKAALSAEERAAKLGFVKHLPQDTEVVMAFHNGAKAAERIQSSKLWKLVQAQMGIGAAGPGMEQMPPIEEPEMNGEDFQLPEGEQDADADDAADASLPNMPEVPAAGEPSGPAVLFGTEFTLALGKSAGDQGANLLTAYRRMGYFQMRTLAKAFAASAKAGDLALMEQAFSEQYGPELIKELLADPESGTALLERMKMPPLYLAFRTSSAERPAAAQQLASLVANLAMLGEEVVEPVEVETAGQSFAGQKISGAKISASMEKNRGEMEKTLEPAVIDKLLAAIAKQDIVIVSGILGDYAVLFIGSSTEDLKFAAEPGQSLVASDALAFCDAYASKELAAVIYGQKGAMDKLIAAAGGLADIANGLRDGLAGSEGLGDTRDLEALLRLVGERESAVRKLSGNETLGVAAFFEEGLKIESYGGNDNGALDWKATNQLASLGASEDVVMFANMTSEAAYDGKIRAYLEALMETSYALAMKVAEAPMEEGMMAEFKKNAKLFDTKFRQDAVAIWDTLSGDFNSSLGMECALIVDLNGSMPAIPGIPQPVVDEGKFPRISLVAPVTDRAKIAASWQTINTSATAIMAKVSELAGKEIPMPKPTSSEKDGFTTWFFSMPVFNDDFMPSVTVGDKWFAASTSKNQAIDLVNKAAKGGAPSTGLNFAMNFKALQKYSRETLQLIEKNAAAIFGEDGMTAEQQQNAANLIEAMDDLDKLTVFARREGGVLRSSVHLKTR